MKCNKCKKNGRIVADAPIMLIKRVGLVVDKRHVVDV